MRRLLPWLPLIGFLLAWAAFGHEIPDGKTPREKCLVQCDREHCDCVVNSKGNCNDKQQRCKRSCDVASWRPRP